MDIEEIERALGALSKRLATIATSLGRGDETVRRRISNAEARLVAKTNRSSVNEATLSASKSSLRVRLCFSFPSANTNVDDIHQSVVLLER